MLDRIGPEGISGDVRDDNGFRAVGGRAAGTDARTDRSAIYS